MEIVTLEYVVKYGDKKECVVLYFKDKQSAEKYKREIEDDSNITFEDDAVGFQYYNDDDEWYSEINDMIVNQAWGRLNPSVASVERVVEERVVEPEFFKVVYFNHSNVRTCRLLRSADELKDYMAKVMEVAVGAVEVIKMSLDQLVEECENA